jgi:uncharacterized protein (DUF58 family)
MIGSQTKLRFGVTDAGKMLLRGTIYIALAALIVPAFGALAILLAVLLTALVIGFVLRPRILVSGNVPDRIFAGQTVLVTYTLQNVGRLPAYDLHLQFQGLPEPIKVAGDVPMVSRLRPGETAQVSVAICPARRGCYQVRPPACLSSFSFNLFHFGTACDEQETWIVLPPLFRLRVPLRCAGRHVTTGGLRPGVRTGTSPEYIGNRPFLAGDSPRRIDVRAWARLAVPATKEYDDDFDSYAALILDTRVPPTGLKAKGGAAPELEAAVSLCASVAYSIHRDCLVDLLLAGPDLQSFTAEPKMRRVERIHELLATVEPSSEYGTEQIAPLLEERFQEISEAIFILLRYDEASRQILELADRAGCRSTVVVVGEPDTGRGSPPWLPEDDRASPYRDILFLSADEILAGRVEHL